MTVLMGVIEDFDNLSKDAQEYLKRRVEGVKMGVVEELSVMMGNAFASLVLFLFLFRYSCASLDRLSKSSITPMRTVIR